MLVFPKFYRITQSSKAHRNELVSAMGHELTADVSSTGSDQKQLNIFDHSTSYLFCNWTKNVLIN